MNGEMSYKQGIYLKLIDRFADSGHKLCEITFTKEDKENRSDEVIMNGITRAAKRYNKWHINAVKRNNKIYMVNKLISK